MEYAELPAVFDTAAAMQEGAPILHENLAGYINAPRPVPSLPNTHSHVKWRLGDAEAGFTESDFVFEQTFTTHRVHQTYLEPHSCVVDAGNGDRIGIWSSNKVPFQTRQYLAEILGVEPSKILIQLGPVGGDFGGKGSVMDIPLAYYLSRATGRPVKMVMTYGEELRAGNPRHPSTIPGKKIAFSAMAAATGEMKEFGRRAHSERKGTLSFFGQTADVQIDPDTGKIVRLKITSLNEVGTIINPIAHQGQIEGGMVQGLGFAMIENLPDAEGRITAANLGDYKIPCVRDIPELETVHVYNPAGPGPFQSKPIGECTTTPTPGAVANAVYDAIGTQILDAPVTAEKIYDALKRGRNIE